MPRFRLPDPDIVLDFVNTRTRDADHLATATAAASWASLIPGLTRTDLELTEADLSRLREVRQLLGQLFDNLGFDSIASVNDLLAGVLLECRLDPAGGATYSIEVDAADAAGAITRVVLGSLVRLAEDSGLTSVRQCAASDCSIRFSSPNARRIWCDTSTCGNRERARRHYRRRTAVVPVQPRGKRS